MIHYRLATADDAPALAQLRWDFRLEETNGMALHSHAEFMQVCTAFVADGIHSGQWVYWISEDTTADIATGFAAGSPAGSRLIACICICIIRKIPKPNKLNDTFGYVTNVYANPNYRNQGIGTQLMSHVVGWANEQDLSNLLVWPSERSVPFYQRAGFVEDTEALTLELREYVL